MPRKFKPRRRFRRRKAKGRVYKKGLPRKALSGAVDTAIERRMVALAKAEVRKNQINLIDRNYYLGSCDPLTNKWTHTQNSRIFFNGAIIQVCKIDRQDITMVLNNPDPADPLEAPPMEQDNDGVQQGQMIHTMHGRRVGDTVNINAFSYSLKVFADRTPNEHDYPAPGTPGQTPNSIGLAAWHQMFLRDATGEYVNYLPETITLEYAIVQVFDEDAAVAPPLAQTPTIQQLLPKFPWGYSSKLDDQWKNEQLFLKKRVLDKGQLTFQSRADLNRDKTIRRYVKLKNSLKLKYLPADQNGVQLVSSRIFFVLRSNIPQRALTQLIDYSPFAPKCALVFKTHYNE